MRFAFSRRYIFLALAISFAFVLGILSASYFVKPEWKCSVCSFSGGEIIPLVNGQYPSVVLAEINSANSNINILMYEMRLYTTNNSVMQVQNALIAAHERGVDVRIILDQSVYQGRVTDLTKDNKKTLTSLVAKGLSIKLDSEKITTHSKIMIVDDREVFVGSTNWGFSAFERNNEANVLIRNKEAVAYYQNYFDYLWESS